MLAERKGRHHFVTQLTQLWLRLFLLPFAFSKIFAYFFFFYLSTFFIFIFSSFQFHHLFLLVFHYFLIFLSFSFCSFFFLPSTSVASPSVCLHPLTHGFTGSSVSSLMSCFPLLFSFIYITAFVFTVINHPCTYKDKFKFSLLQRT